MNVPDLFTHTQPGHTPFPLHIKADQITAGLTEADRGRFQLGTGRISAEIVLDTSANQAVREIILEPAESGRKAGRFSLSVPDAGLAANLSALIREELGTAALIRQLGQILKEDSSGIRVSFLPDSGRKTLSVYNEKGEETSLLSISGPRSIEQLAEWLCGRDFSTTLLEQARGGDICRMIISLESTAHADPDGIVCITAGKKRWYYPVPVEEWKAHSLQAWNAAAQRLMDVFVNEGLSGAIKYLDPPPPPPEAEPEDIQHISSGTDNQDGGAATAERNYYPPGKRFVGALGEVKREDLREKDLRKRLTLSSGSTISFFAGENETAIEIAPSAIKDGYAIIYTRSNSGWGKWWRERAMQRAFNLIVSEDPHKQQKALKLLGEHPIQAIFRWSDVYQPVLEETGDIARLERRDELQWRTPSYPGRQKAFEAIQGREHAIVHIPDSPIFHFCTIEFSLDISGNGSLTARNRLGDSIVFELPVTDPSASSDVFERKTFLKKVMNDMAVSSEEALATLYSYCRQADSGNAEAAAELNNRRAAYRIYELHESWAKCRGSVINSLIRENLNETPPVQGRFQTSFISHASGSILTFYGNQDGVRRIRLQGTPQQFFGKEQNLEFRISPENSRTDFQEALTLFDTLTRHEGRYLRNTRLTALLTTLSHSVDYQ